MFYADSNGFYYLWYEMSVPCAEVYENGNEDGYYVRRVRTTNGEKYKPCRLEMEAPKIYMLL